MRRSNHDDDLDIAARNVCVAFQERGLTAGIEALSALAVGVGSGGFGREFIGTTLQALLSNDWTTVGHAFADREFIGSDGRFLLIGPYTMRRSGVASTALTGIYGLVVQGMPRWDFALSLQQLFGEAGKVADVVPFECLASFGCASGTHGEAFLVPDAWGFITDSGGPALNNATAQQHRFDNFSHNCLTTIFAKSSADLLMAGLTNTSLGGPLRQREFQFHEAGHASGLGLARKLADDVLVTPWYRGVEEWRADGVEFELLTQMIDVESAGQTISANYCLRFGLDAHRQGGLEQDTDVISTLLTFNSLLRGHALRIDGNRKLRFRDESFAGLVDASAVHRHQAIELTKSEMFLSGERGLWMLYGSIQVDPASHMLFDGLVRHVCRDVPGERPK